jgi:hypothetical protein
MMMLQTEWLMYKAWDLPWSLLAKSPREGPANAKFKRTGRPAGIPICFALQQFTQNNRDRAASWNAARSVREAHGSAIRVRNLFGKIGKLALW